MREMRQERRVKADGRYLIYYSWPSDEAAADRPAGEPLATERASASARPPQRPWNPQAGPSDV